MLSFLGGCAKPASQKWDLYLLIGQSNMAGRGKLDNESKDSNPGIWVINAQNVWSPAADPLHDDFPKAVGVGPGLAFAKAIQPTNKGRNIGLIPCAVGGTSIDDWVAGVRPKHTEIYPYDAMLRRVKEAQKKGRIRAILWHQGEQDSNPAAVKDYARKLEAFFTKLRSDIGANNVPILVGTIGDFYARDFPDALTINKIMTQYAASHRNVYLVSSAGLKDKGDAVHFDSESARKLGGRYATKLLEVTGKHNSTIFLR